MKALSHRIKKLWRMLKFFKSRSKVMIKVTCSTFMVPSDTSCHKVHTCQISNPYLLQLKCYGLCYSFYKSRSKVTVKVKTSKFMVPLERSWHKDHTCQV